MKRQQVCSTCGESFNEDEMESMNTGRRIQYLCRECYKSGYKNADYRRHVQMDRIIHRKDREGNL